MKPTAFIAGLAQETNAFGPLPTGLGSFRGRFHAGGRTCMETPPFPEVLLHIGRRLADEGEVTLIEGPTAGAHPSGAVTRAAYEMLRDTILARLRAAGPVDLAIFHLHGAMIADGYDDCEGDLLTRVREIVGPDAHVGAMVDPHAHLSEAMLRASDMIIAYKEYPHTDFRERAGELWAILLDLHRCRYHPAAALWDSGAIGIFHSSDAGVRGLIDAMQSLEAVGSALSVSLIHGFPWGDGEAFGTRALVFADGEAAADRLASEIAVQARALAMAARAQAIGIDAAIARMRAHPDGAKPLVFADSPDNPGGGAAGDATHVLRAILDAGIGQVCLGPIWDPGAVDVAFNAGPGAKLNIRVGGKSGPLSGDPLDLAAEILAVDGAAAQCFAGEEFPLGRAASLRVGTVFVVITSERDQARSPELFSRLGVDPAAQRAVIVKSSQHFRAAFEAVAAEILYLDGPGSLQLNLSGYAYKSVRRPRFPIDPVGADPFRVMRRPANASR
jgi:microcystin degradation protein MlrC